jgi:ATP phosphoribosyltransferase
MAALSRTASQMGLADSGDAVTIHLALPKGHMQVEVEKLLEAAGMKVANSSARGYRPSLPLPNYDVKLLKPQNILGMLQTGSRDLGFGGADWVEELHISGLVEVFDTGLDPVRIVAAGPPGSAAYLSSGKGRDGRRLIVASEYETLTRRWLDARGIEYTFLRAYGATESLPPEDADIIVDNAATGSTLRANNLEVHDTLMHSTTRLYASAAAWADPAKRTRIERFIILLRAVTEARKRLMVTFNIPADKLEGFLGRLPAARAPTVSPLHHAAGFAVQIAVEAGLVPQLIPQIKAEGGQDIVVTTIRMMVS